MKKTKIFLNRKDYIILKVVDTQKELDKMWNRPKTYCEHNDKSVYAFFVNEENPFNHYIGDIFVTKKHNDKDTIMEELFHAVQEMEAEFINKHRERFWNYYATGLMNWAKEFESEKT